MHVLHVCVCQCTHTPWAFDVYCSCAVLAHCRLHRRPSVGAVLLCGRRFSGLAVLQRGCAGQPGRHLAFPGARGPCCECPGSVAVLVSVACMVYYQPHQGVLLKLQEHSERLTAALDAAGMKVPLQRHCTATHAMQYADCIITFACSRSICQGSTPAGAGVGNVSGQQLRLRRGASGPTGHRTAARP
jgi:hypothetical protein